MLLTLPQPRRKAKPISDESESTEEAVIRRKVKPAEKIRTRQQEPVPDAPCRPSELPEEPAESVTPENIGPLSAKSVVEKGTDPSQLVREGLLSPGRKSPAIPSPGKSHPVLGLGSSAPHLHFAHPQWGQAGCSCSRPPSEWELAAHS